MPRDRAGMGSAAARLCLKRLLLAIYNALQFTRFTRSTIIQKIWNTALLMTLIVLAAA